MKKFVAKIFIAVEMAMLLLVAVSWVGRHAFAEFKLKEPVKYSFAEEYPIEMSGEDYIASVEKTLESQVLLSEIPEDVTDTDTEEAPLTYKPRKAKTSGILFKISDLISSKETRLESFTNAKKLAGRQLFVNAKKSLDRLTGLDMTNSATGGQNSQTDNRDVIALTEEGQLGWAQDSQEIVQEVKDVAAFGLDMLAEGRNFVILEPPNKFATTAGYRDYSEVKYAYLHGMLDAYGLDQIRAGDKLKELGLTGKDIFFDTDFHWKPSSGILTAGILGEYLNSNCGYSIDLSYYDLDNYDVETEEDGFLGFMGKKVTEVYSEPDDFSIWTPKFPTNLTVWNSYDLSEKTGSIQETLFWYDQLKTPSLYEGNKYEFYGYSDQSLIRIHNNDIQDGKRILMIKNSYANCLYPYLAAGVENLDVMDIRGFDGSICKFIEETQPDTIVLVYGLSSYENFTKEGSLFDFR